MDTNGSNGSALAVVEPHSSMEANVGVLMRRATDVAGVCRDIVQKTAQAIQGRKYVRVEGWQSIAVAYGCVASARDVELVPGGVRAIGEVRRMSDGAVVSTAEGFVGEDEVVWFGGTDSKGKKHERRPMFAVRAMAQTRAISRACRSAFSFVVTLIDGNLSTTPFEEMDGLVVEGSVEPPAPVGTAGLKAKLGPPPSPPKPGSATHDRNYVFAFANKENAPLHALSEKNLAWYRKALTDNLADPAKAQWADNNKKLLDLVLAEQKWRGLA